MVEKFFFITLCFFASLLVFLATPRFFASIEMLYANSVLQQLDKTGKYPLEKVYLKTYSKIDNAIEWTDTGLYWHKLSHLNFINYTGSADKIDIISDLHATTEIALEMMPVAPYTWHNLALINFMILSDDDGALAALKMSVYIDRVNRKLFKPRVLLLWRKFESLDEELRDIFKSQLLLLWQFKRRELVTILLKYPGIEYSIFEVLLDSPDDMKAFNQILERQVR